MGNGKFVDEAYRLSSDNLDGAESADADVEEARNERRLRGEPTMAREEAVWRANEHLRAEGLTFVADTESALPNGMQDLWVVSYHDPATPEVVLSGGGLVVSAAGEVRDLSSAPGQPEMLGVTFPSDEETAWVLPEDWDAVLGETLRSRGWSDLMDFVDLERTAGVVFPPAESVFRAFELTPYAEVRVVILGQDPYHGEGQAHGLAFSVAEEKLTPSLRTIRKELERDPEAAPPEGGNLEGWANQGVLLLNTVLTVRSGVPNSHRGRGWEDFTDAVIRAVNKKSDRVVFLLWGASAQKKARLVTNKVHEVICAAHPAARANAHNPLVTSGSFSRANNALVDAKRAGIEWDLSGGPS